MRIPNFSPPPPAQRFVNTNPSVPSSSNELQPALRNFDAERKRQERARENEQQRAQRLTYDRLRKLAARQNEDDMEHTIRLTYDQQRKEAVRHNEDESQRNARLILDRQQKETTRQNEDESQQRARLTLDRQQKEALRQNEDESQRNARLTLDRQQKEAVRQNEDESQRNARLTLDRQQKEAVRQNEDESQRNARLTLDRQQKEAVRQNEDESQRNKRLADDRQQKEATRATESAEKTNERIRSISVRRRQRSLENKNRAKSDRLHWPRAIPTQQKDRCLQDFVKQTSMSLLKQTVCAVCNLRTFVSLMNEYDVNQIPNQARLACHPDLLRIIPGTGSVPPGSPRYLLESKRDSLSFKIPPQIQPATAYPI